MTAGPGLLLALTLAAPDAKEGAKPAPADHALVGGWVVDGNDTPGRPLPRGGKIDRATVTRDR